MLRKPTPTMPPLFHPASALVSALALASALLTAPCAFGAGAHGTAERLKARPKPKMTVEQALSPERDARRIIVKLQDDAGTSARGDRLLAAPGRRGVDAAATVNRSLVGIRGVRVEPVFTLPEVILDALRSEGQRRTGKALADLSQFYLVHLPDADSGRRLVSDLLPLPEIEAAYAVRQTRGPSLPPTTPTPNLETAAPGQSHRDPGPDGIDIEAAWNRGYDGSGVTVADIEQGWNLAHEDLAGLLGQVPPVPLIAQSQWAPAPLSETDHGTATLGVLAAGDNGFGTTGLIPGATIRVAPLGVTPATSPTWVGPNSVVLAALELQAGDVMLIEAQLPQNYYGTINVPFESDPAEYAAVRQATALGIHVIEPAGNTTGGLDLDTSSLVESAPGGPSKFDRYFRDSGAVLVGAGESAVTPDYWNRPRGYHAAYANSNHGSKVDTYAWGQNVTTLGYGPRSPSVACNRPGNPFPLCPADLNRQYTYCFNGTSSAGAIVAGATAVLEQKHRQDFGQAFTVREMRNLLSLGTYSTGVGHQPELAYQMDFMDRGGLIPHLFEAEAEISWGSSFGHAVAGGGDVDGDGVPDVIVGAPNFTPAPGLEEAGRVYVFSGADGSLLYRVDGQAAYDHFGYAVDIGDGDFDPWADFAVGAPGADVGSFTDAGQVTLFSGLNGLPYNPFSGAAADERYGAAVAFVGNVNPAGSAHPQPEPFDDLLIGAPGPAMYSSQNGRVEVVNFLTRTVLHSFNRSQQGDEFGFAVAGAGDLDGDGAADLLIGAPGFFGSGGSTGIVHAVSGDDGQTLFSREGRRYNGLPALGLRYGAALDGAGDFDGDGWPEVVVGAPGTAVTGPGGTGGLAHVLDRAGAVVATFIGTHPRDRFGTSVAGLGDFDGDGLDDIAVGSPSQVMTSLSTREGQVFVFMGANGVASASPNPDAEVPPSIPNGSYRQRRFWTQDYDTLWGFSVDAVGDLNGDGRADLVTGEPGGEEGGRAFVFSIAPGPDRSTGQVRLIADLPVIEAHDIDGDTFGGGVGCSGMYAGARSPSNTIFNIDAGPAWAGANFLIAATPDVGTYLRGASGMLDANGRIELTVARPSLPTFGPVEANLLCQGIGVRFNFISAVYRVDASGQLTYRLSNDVDVEIINEWGTCGVVTPVCP